MARLPRPVALGFAAAIACLIATVVVISWLERVRDEQARLVQHTTEALLALEEVESAMLVATASVDAHLGQGAGWERNLTALALARIEPGLARLELLADDAPEDAGRYRRLADGVRALVGPIHQALAVAQSGEEARAAALLGEVGPESVPPVQALVVEAEGAERARLAQRQVTWRRAALTGAVAFGASTLVLLLLILAAARMVRREMAARERLSGERAEMLALQQQLMAVVGHDLRNPLAAMKSAASLIARDPEADEDHREDARRIVSNARRMERLIRDLLDFSRLRSGRGLPIQQDEADLVDLVRRAVADLGRDAEGRVTVEGRGDVWGRWDPDRLEQVVANLVVNALKYGPPQQPVRVLVDGSQAGGEEVHLSVRDEGGGLPADQHELIFQPFRRGRAGDSQERRSAGLGLYIVAKVAEAHGGAVAVDSAPERGTTFTVRLPRGRPPAAARAAAGA